MKNYRLGRKVLEYIEAHQKEYNQANFGSRYSCGTRACLAGHTLLLSGYRLKMSTYLNRDGEFIHPGDEAASLLGLTPEEYYGDALNSSLFSGLVSEEEAIENFRTAVERSEKAGAEAGQLHEQHE